MPKIVPPCDRDCFHCPYPDCVKSDYTAEDRASERLVNFLLKDHPVDRTDTKYHTDPVFREKQKEYARAYYWKRLGRQVGRG